MKTVEKACIWMRHSSLLQNADWLWDGVRPLYERAITHVGSSGLERLMNGSDRILVSPQARDVPETYEPAVWRALMSEIKPGDRFVDVGAFIGLYTIAVGLRLRDSGRVVAFEPEAHNYSLLQEHVKLNRIESQVELHQIAVSDNNGQRPFLTGGSSQARLASSDREHATPVTTVKLDDFFAGTRVDILKIDVEGHEEMVLRGAHKLLRTPVLRPRTIFVEVHPYAWSAPIAGSNTLLGLLNEAGYRVQTVDGAPVLSIESYGEIVARI
jgi:FkbM family methyltransferase